MGLGLRIKQAQVISLQQEEVLWNKSLLGEHDGPTLMNTLLYLLGLNFALRSGQEHRSLTREQLQFGHNDRGRFLEYTEKISKNNRRGLKHVKVLPKNSKAYARTDCPSRCVVRLYELYLSHCPEYLGSKSPVYLKSLKKVSGEVWYCCVPVGQHSLGSVVGNMCKAAGFEGILLHLVMFNNNCNSFKQ
jgi:hypothetical protein